MNRMIAKNIHEAVNASFWIENKDWDAGNTIANLACTAIRSLPFSIPEFQKYLFFKNPDDITVSGESIVVPTGNTVDKYMFRYPSKYSQTEFHAGVSSEVKAVTSHLAHIALPTLVSVKTADIFRRPFTETSVVTQTQPRIDLLTNQPLDLDYLDITQNTIERTARDLEQLLADTAKMVNEEGLYPDISSTSGNVRRNVHTGELALIDVMPIHADGTRLIGDWPSKLPHTLENIVHYEDFIGHYGA